MKRNGTSNIEHPTPNIQGTHNPRPLDVRCWMFDVGCLLLAAGIVLLQGSLSSLAQQLPPAEPPERMQSLRGNFIGQTDRPLRYFPDGTDFVITNGVEFFNRPLYGGNVAFRVDAGDKPEFSLYVPGRGGNLRFAIKTNKGIKWLNDVETIIARYRPGSMIYEIRDPVLGRGRIQLHASLLPQGGGLITRAQLLAGDSPVELLWAFGGADGMRGRRSGDIGCETLPVSQFFQLRPEQCAGDKVTPVGNGFTLVGPRASIAGVASAGAEHWTADADQWRDAARLFSSVDGVIKHPLVAGVARIEGEKPVFLALQVRNTNAPSLDAQSLASFFAAAETQRSAIAGRVTVETPDPFVNAAAAALCIAGDAVWDERQSSFMHGAVAWRTRLLGWRCGYLGDALGWHDRTRRHLAGHAKEQITDPIPESIPVAEAAANLARNENALHSNGNMTKKHYDMNLVAVDVFFRHLLWTGDLEFAREYWPVLERHMAWERRLFRREYGESKLPLYEGYACFWASDDVAYNGGGAAMSSAYNYYHNKMTARLAHLLGKDPALYEQEAKLIAQAMRQELWLSDLGWFAEYKDWLGLQRVHPTPAVWSIYHVIDSEVPTPLEAWQLTEFINSEIPHIPIGGPNVPAGSFTIPSSTWMPYGWSVNNVVMAEVMHTSLACWQANRVELAFPLFKGALLDSMFLGLCPGNVGMATEFDAYRHESQRDFSDGVGATSRALLEGLFGLKPDVLAGELTIRPGFPADWDHASIRHPDLDFSFKRDGASDTFILDSRFSKPMALRMQVAAARDKVAGVLVNGKPAEWRVLADSVGSPRIEIKAAAASRHEVIVHWDETSRMPATGIAHADQSGRLEARFGSARVVEISDPQRAMKNLKRQEQGFVASSTALVGRQTAFTKLEQGDLTWWEPVSFAGRATLPAMEAMDWSRPIAGQFEEVELSGQFNDQVTQIFRNEYLSPRSPFCSLAVPKQGIGSWCLPNTQFDVDDAGLRSLARSGGNKVILPNGIPLRTPGEAEAKNILFVSQWDNYPREASVKLSGKASHAYLLMAGSSNPMQTRIDNGEVVVTYADGTTDRLPLHNPTTWWPIDQDYFIDDYAFARPEPLPVRVDLKTGRVRVLKMDEFKGRGGKIPGGAATVLDLPLAADKELQSLTVRALANEVVIGLMSVTLQR
jgi:hypothetical protein